MIGFNTFLNHNIARISEKENELEVHREYSKQCI